ncbi:MAG: bifunctional folylpolyglutamate synthase/dihydrofolate synthase [Geobacter sp.]|nr:bifunctional folylpolyglutamate synthase/dihydrofolate synthase [Geobacter sp.]
MTYQETLAHIFGLTRFGIRPGLERITTLLARLGNPQQRVRTVSIAGTNGKGSTAAFLSSILAAAGLKVGLFTSPHLISFTERFLINGREIGEAEVTELAAEVLAVAPPETTFFEIVTAMALHYFAREKVDLLVMEAGMGGRSDATNTADPLLSVLTPISYDHCEYLGDTLTAIAREKAGIIRKDRPVVSAGQESEAADVLADAATAAGARLYMAGRDFSASWQGDDLVYHGLHTDLTDLRPGLFGRHQAGNAACALAAAEILAAEGVASIPLQALRQGVAQAKWPGRMELFAGPPPVLLDGAHNPAGSRALAGSLADLPRQRLILVTGVMGDKDAAAILDPLLPLASRVFAVAAAMERAMTPHALAHLVAERRIPCTVAGRVADGLSQAMATAAADDLVLVCGSLFVVGEARAWLLSRPCLQVRG